MGITIKSLSKNSVLRKQVISVPIFNTANLKISGGINGSLMAPFDCVLEKILICNDVDITASNGITLSVCNATTDVIHLAAATDGNYWSCSMATPLYCASGSLDYTANIFCELNPCATTLIKRGDILNVNFSASIGDGPIAISFVLNPAQNVR